MFRGRWIVDSGWMYGEFMDYPCRLPHAGSKRVSYTSHVLADITKNEKAVAVSTSAQHPVPSFSYIKISGENYNVCDYTVQRQFL